MFVDSIHRCMLMNIYLALKSKTQQIVIIKNTDTNIYISCTQRA